MADLIPTIVLAMGAVAVCGPDALRFLLAFAGRSPVIDIAICVFAIAAVLGAMLLARYSRLSVARNAAAAGGAVPPTPDAELFPKMVLMVALAVAITACLLSILSQAAGSGMAAGQYACSA